MLRKAQATQHLETRAVQCSHYVPEWLFVLYVKNHVLMVNIPQKEQNIIFGTHHHEWIGTPHHFLPNASGTHHHVSPTIIGTQMIPDPNGWSSFYTTRLLLFTSLLRAVDYRQMVPDVKLSGPSENVGSPSLDRKAQAQSH